MTCSIRRTGAGEHERPESSRATQAWEPTADRRVNLRGDSDAGWHVVLEGQI